MPVPMNHTDFAQLLDNLRSANSSITSGTPVKVVLFSGDIVDVEKVEWSFQNGGEIRIVAGPTEMDEPEDVLDDVGDEVDDQGGMSEYR